MQNTVDGFSAAATASDTAFGRAINLATGREISIGDLASLIQSMTGVSLDIRVEDERLRPGASEVERLLGDGTLAGELLGWSPRVDLEDGLRQTIEWIRGRTDYSGATYVT